MSDLLINASILAKNNTGLGVYTLQMLKYLCPILVEEGISFDIMCGSKDYLPDDLKAYAKVVPFNGVVSRNLNTSKVYNDGYKLVWSTTQHGSIFSHTNQIISIHDITPILYPNGRLHQKFYYKKILPLLISKSVSVITVSDNTKKDILTNYSKQIHSDEKVKVIRESIEKIERDNSNATDILNKFGVTKNLYLCITGIHYEYKNIHLVLKAFAENKALQNLKVIIIGNDNNQYGKYLHSLSEKYNLNDIFIFTGYISKKERDALLSNSFACVYPSLYEGFGLPLLEAMQAGVPVISSNASSLPEVGGDSAIYFDPTSTDDLCNKILMLLNNKELRNEYISKGYKNLLRFDWNNIAHEMFNHLSQFL